LAAEVVEHVFTVPDPCSRVHSDNLFDLQDVSLAVAVLTDWWFRSYFMQNDNYNTPLIHAARGGHARCLQLLLEHVPKVTVRAASIDHSVCSTLRAADLACAVFDLATMCTVLLKARSFDLLYRCVPGRCLYDARRSRCYGQPSREGIFEFDLFRTKGVKLQFCLRSKLASGSNLALVEASPF